MNLQEFWNNGDFKDTRFEDFEDMVFLDFDRHFFTKCTTHPIFYRLSASRHGFHVAFKRSWLTDSEFFLLLRQCDHDWLCKCIVDECFRIAKNKNGQEATEWRLTVQLTERGELQSHTKKILASLNKYPKLRVATVHYEDIIDKVKRLQKSSKCRKKRKVVQKSLE